MERNTFNDTQDIKDAIKELRFRLDDSAGVSVAFPETPELVEAIKSEKIVMAEKPAETEKPAAPEKPAEPEKPEQAEEAAEELPKAEKPVAVEEPEKPVEADKPAKAPKAPQPKERRPNSIIFGKEPVLPYSMEEAVNRLRINISFLGNDVKKIMIVSSEPNEGKSFVAMNLWKQMAISGEPSILLDLDMRKSNIVDKYQLTREDGKELRGMTHFLSGNEPVEDMILHTYMEHGDILPNVDNVINPSMLLESRKFSEMMKYMEDHYRYVFVDVPPLGLVSDGELIGNACDGALLCVRGGVTSRAIVRRSIRQIERTGCQILGIVLNRVGGGAGGYYHKYYGKKYYNDQYYTK